MTRALALALLLAGTHPLPLAEAPEPPTCWDVRTAHGRLSGVDELGCVDEEAPG